jgi:hypothetical protein
MTNIDLEARLDDALCRLRDVVRPNDLFHEPPPPTREDRRKVADDLEIVLEALARYRFGPPWLVPVVRVQWRDVDGELQNRNFDSEAEARAFGATKTDEPLQFRRDLETNRFPPEVIARVRKENERLKAAYPDAFLDAYDKGSMDAAVGELHHPNFPAGMLDWPPEKQDAWYAGYVAGADNPIYPRPILDRRDDAQAP